MATPSTLNAVIARVAAGLYDIQLGYATMDWAVKAVTSAPYNGSVAGLVQTLYATDFKSHDAAAAALIKNLGLTGTLGTTLTAAVKGMLDTAGAGHEGETIVAILNGVPTQTSNPTPEIAAAAQAFNAQITAALKWASVEGSTDSPVHPPQSTFFTIEPGTAAGASVMHLTGNQDVRIDFTNKDHQIRGLDLDGDGLIKADGKENNSTYLEANVDMVADNHANFAIVDAYARTPLDHTDSANNFLGDIYYDGTGYKGDGVSTNGNIFLGGLGVDTALGGIGNDFLAGGGIAQGRSGADTLSGGRNADFFFAELSLLSATDGNSVKIDGGTTADNTQAGVAQSSQDADWLLLEASDDDEPTTIILRDDSVVDPSLSALTNINISGTSIVANEFQSAGGTQGGVNQIDTTGGVFTRAGVSIGTLRDIENFDASGNLYGFLNNISTEIGGRAVDDRDAAGNANYGLGSSAQLRIVGSNVGNVIIGGYDNDYIEGWGGNDLIFGGNLKQFLETVDGGVTNPNLAGIANDGIDYISGGDGNDNIVWEADGGTYAGDAGTDTLWLTKYALGAAGTTALMSDGKLRFDLTSENAQTEGSNPEGGAGYGGRDSAGTQEQSKFASSANRTTVTGMENLDATGLGAIDYWAAGTNSPELTFANHQNFGGYNGAMDLRGSQGNNQIYSGEGDDIIEGRGNAAPTSGTTAVTQIDDLEGNKGKDDFYFAIDGDFTVGGASNGGLGIGGSSAGDGYDVIRRKIDANADGFWDGLTPTSGSAVVWGQDFGLDSDSTTGASVLTIDVQKAGGNSAGTELNQVVNSVTQIITGVKVGTTFVPVKLNSTDLQSATTYAQLTAAINKELASNAQFGVDLTAKLLSDGHTIQISDKQGRELADSTAEVPAAGVSVNQLANTATQNTFVYGQPPVTTVQDRLIYKAYEDRSDNEGVDDDAAFGSTISLGVDAYAQDLVVSFQKDASTTFGSGTTTFLAEDQRWEINFDNLTTQDRVTVEVNGVKYTLQVGYQLDGTIIANEDTNSGTSQVNIQTNFLSRLAGYINSFSDDDTAAGSVNAGSSATKLTLVQNTYNSEQTVYMRAPKVAVENLSGGQAPNNPVWDNPATAATEGTGIVNASQHEVQLYQFDGTNNRLNTDNVKFWGQEEVQRSVLATSKDAGGAIDGMDAMVVDGEANTILSKGDLAAKVTNSSALIDPTQDGVVDRLVTTNSALTVNFAVHGDDLIITGKGVDIVRTGTGDDRVVGSVGSTTAPAVGATAGGELLDGGKNFYAVKLLDEAQARVYVLNKWESNTANIVSVLPELSGKVITSVTQIGQTQNGTNVTGAGASNSTASAFNDTLQYQQEDFGPNARFTITLDDFSVVGGVVQTTRDGAGLVSIDADGNGQIDSYARFTNFENVRTVSGTGSANAATSGVADSGGQGNDTLDVSLLSTKTGGISYDLTNNLSAIPANGQSTAGDVRYSADAHGARPPAVPSATDLALAALRPVGDDFETLVLKVDGVENVIAGDGDDLLFIDETEAAKNNSFTAGLGDDRIVYQNNWTAGVSSPSAEPTVTINVNSTADTDTVVMTGGRLGNVVATDTLSSVEFISLNGGGATAHTAKGLSERDVVNAANVVGATIDYNDLVQSSATTGTGVANSGTVRNANGGIEVTIENMFEMEQVVGSSGNDTVKVADASVMGLNAREDATDATQVAPITFGTFIDYDQLGTVNSVPNKRIAFVGQSTAVPSASSTNIENVRNNGEFKFDLGAGTTDTVDYSNAADAIAVVVELDPTKADQYVLVDSDDQPFFGGLNDLTEAGDRIDVLTNVERIVASQNESVLDLTSSTKGLEIKWSAFDSAARVLKTATVDAFDVYTVRISDLSSGSPLTRTYMEYRDAPDVDDAAIADKATATWNRIEGSDNAEVVIVNSAHSADDDTFNLRGGANQVKYNELTRSITTTILVQDYSASNPLGVVASGYTNALYASTNAASATQQLGTVMAVTQFQDGNGAALGNGKTHVATSYTNNNGITATNNTGGGSLRIAASQDAEDTLLFQGLSSKLFILSEVGTTDNQITVKIGSGSTQNSLTLTGYERVTDAGSDDVYDFSSNQTSGLSQTLAAITITDNGSDHDAIKVPNQAVNYNGSGANTIDLDNLSAAVSPGFNFDFDVLDVTAVTNTGLILNGGTNAAPVETDADETNDNTDEVVLGALNAVVSINDFEGIVLTAASAATTPTYTFKPAVSGTAGSLTQGTTVIPLASTVGGANVDSLSFSGTTLESTYGNGNVASVSTAVTVSVSGTVGAKVFGGTGNDVITGAGGADFLRGAGGDDTLDGGFSQELRQIQLDGILSGTTEANTVVVTFTGGAAFAINVVEGVEVVAGAGSDAVGTALATKINANLAAINAGATWNGGASLVSASFDAGTDLLSFRFTPGINVTGTIAITENDSGTSFIASSETTVSDGSDGGIDTFIFESSAAKNGADTINNFVAASGASDDLLDFTAFLGGAAAQIGVAANGGTGDLTMATGQVGIMFNKASLSNADAVAAGTAANGELVIAAGNGFKGVVLVTADTTGAAGTAANDPYKVYYVYDSDATAGVSLQVTLVGTINSASELTVANLLGTGNADDAFV